MTLPDRLGDTANGRLRALRFAKTQFSGLTGLEENLAHFFALPFRR